MTFVLYSPSQITTFRDCQRKWGWRYISGIKTPPHPSAELGIDVDDNQLQPYLRDGKPLDFSKRNQSGYIAATSLGFLPQPKTPGMVLQKHFTLPSPTSKDFGIQGFMDLWHPDSKVMPNLPESITPIPAVADFKTTSDLKWAKGPEQLKVDVQAMTYACDAMYETGARVVDLVWVYMQTKGTKKAKRTHLRVAADHVATQFKAINQTAEEMHAINGSVTDPLELPANPEMCDAYGGCPYRDKCNLSPIDILTSKASHATRQLPPGESTVSNAPNLLAQLKAKKNGGASTPVTAPVPVQLAPASGVQTAPVQLTFPLTTKAGIPVANIPAAFAGINPPESKIEVETPAAAEPPKPRGRPRKTDKDPLGADALIGTPETVTVTWGAEKIQPFPFNEFTVGPFATTVTINPGETIAAATQRAYDQLESFAVAARELKARSFAAAVGAGAK